MKLNFEMVLAYEHSLYFKSNCLLCYYHKHRKDIDAHMCTGPGNGREVLINSLALKGYYTCSDMKLKGIKQDLKKL